MLTALLFIIFVLILTLHVWRRNRFPGPPRMPILGSMPFLGSLNRGLIDWTLRSDVTKHPVSLVQAVREDLYIINDFELAKDLFSQEAFSFRNANYFVRSHRFWTKGISSGIIFNNGDGWSTQRRFSLRTLRDFGFGKQSMEGAMNVEIDDMIDRYIAQKGDVLISTDFNLPIINILWQMVANSRLNDEKGERMVELVNHLFTKPRFSHMLPPIILQTFPNATDYGARVNVLLEHKSYLMNTINEHEDTFDEGHLRDFIDVYLAQMRSDKEGLYTKTDLCSILLDFFHAGTETSSTTLKWLLLYLTLNQESQERCQVEVQQVLGSSRPELRHMQDLHYLMATLSEVQRMSFTAPMTLPHNSTKDINIAGHNIPKGATIHANISFMMNDPKHFPKPELFDPNRFLDKNGKFVKNERLVPFGIGKRLCMGELLARNEIFLFAANLVQKLKFLPPVSHQLPSVERYKINLTRIPEDFYIRIQPVEVQ